MRARFINILVLATLLCAAAPRAYATETNPLTKMLLQALRENILKTGLLKDFADKSEQQEERDQLAAAIKTARAVVRSASQAEVGADDGELQIKAERLDSHKIKAVGKIYVGKTTKQSTKQRSLGSAISGFRQIAVKTAAGGVEVAAMPEEAPRIRVFPRPYRNFVHHPKVAERFKPLVTPRSGKP